MQLSFREELPLPASAVYAYFRTPEDWVRPYGAFGQVEELEDGCAPCA
jgi:hypothetical protein